MLFVWLFSAKFSDIPAFDFAGLDDKSLCRDSGTMVGQGDGKGTHVDL